MRCISCKLQNMNAAGCGQLSSATASPRRPGIRRSSPAQVKAQRSSEEGEGEREEKPAKQAATRRRSEAYCVNLNEKAKLPARSIPLIGRDMPRWTAPSRSCAAGQKNNPLFVGDPGVGKTAIAEGLAKRKIIKGEVPEVLRGKSVIYSRSTWVR